MYCGLSANEYLKDAGKVDIFNSNTSIPYIAKCSGLIIFSNFRNEVIRENFYREFYKNIIPMI